MYPEMDLIIVINTHNKGMVHELKNEPEILLVAFIEDLDKEEGGWLNAASGWEGRESTLCLTYWTQKRRVIVLRREDCKKKRQIPKDNVYTLLGDSVEVLTSLSMSILFLLQIYPTVLNNYASFVVFELTVRMYLMS